MTTPPRSQHSATTAEDSGNGGGPRAAEPPLLQLDGVSVCFPGQSTPTLSDIDLRLWQGEFLSIVGPSGCGKSTLLRVMAGLLPMSAGTRTVPAELERAGGIAMVFQESRLLAWRSVWKNMTLPYELTGRSVDEARIEDLLRRTGLSPADFGKYPRMLSGGMKMRVAVARALVLEPRLILLDEPFAAVDDLLRERLNEELLSLQAEFGFAAVLVTHHLGEAAWLSQRLLRMSAGPGRLAAEYRPPWRTARPANLRDSAEFVQFTSTLRQALRDEM